jgi:hypothetical protein
MRAGTAKLRTLLRGVFGDKTPETNAQLRRSGILRDAVFGADLAEYADRTGSSVPALVKACAAAIERQGTVEGIYRVNGSVTSVQRLRVAFDTASGPIDLSLFLGPDGVDVHCVASTFKGYFRDLPNPLLTHALYAEFDAVGKMVKVTRPPAPQAGYARMASRGSPAALRAARPV